MEQRVGFLATASEYTQAQATASSDSIVTSSADCRNEMNFAGYAVSHQGKPAAYPANVKTIYSRSTVARLNLNGHVASKLFEPLSRSFQASDNRVHSQGFFAVFVDSSMNGSLAGYLRQNVECVVDVILQTFDTGH